MIEYICDNCGARIDDLPEEAKKNLSERHICKDCIKGWIREYAKKVADAPLGYASYELLTHIYWNIEGAWHYAGQIEHPASYTPICPTCGSEMKMFNPAKFENFCEKCMAIYDRYGKKVRDVETEEPARPSAGMCDTAREIAKEEEEKLRKEGKWF